MDLECKRKAGLLPRSPHYQHHVHFASDGGQTVTSSFLATCDIKGENSHLSVATCPLDIISDSLPSVSSMEAEPSEVTSTTSGALEENPVQIALVQNVPGVEGADLVISEGMDIKMEPIVCEGEEMGDVLECHQVAGDTATVNDHGESPVFAEKGVTQEAPRSVSLKRAASIESIV